MLLTTMKKEKNTLVLDIVSKMSFGLLNIVTYVFVFEFCRWSKIKYGNKLSHI